MKRLLPLLFLTVAASPPAPVQSYDEYKSWLVACDNTLSCVAKGFGEGELRAEMKIEREAGPAGKLTATIVAENSFALGDVRADGKAVVLDAKLWKRTADEGTTLSTESLPAIRALVAQLRNASVLNLGAASVPLDGFTAAALRLDERQGRIGGETALLRVGGTPASAVPAAPPLPRVANRPVKARLAAGEAGRLITAVRKDQRALFAKEDCEAQPGSMEASANALDDARAIVLIPCIMGAYQGSSLAFIAPRKGGGSQQLTLPTPYGGNKPSTEDVAYFTESEFDPETGALFTAAKGRGIADCGHSASWIWNGSRFQLAEFSYQGACGGMYPGDWPTLFRSER